MPEQFLHGVEVVEIDSGPRPIRTVRSSVVGLIGTAPDADENQFPVNHPVLIAGKRSESAGLGSTGTLPAAIDDIFDQTGAMIVVIRVEDSDEEPSSEVEVGPAIPNVGQIIGGIDDETGQYLGIQAFLAAENEVHVTPRILIAPEFSHHPAVANELLSVAERLRAVVIADGPNYNDEEAIDYRQMFGSSRLYLVDPWVRVWNAEDNVEVVRPASARVAGLIAKSDAESESRLQVVQEAKDMKLRIAAEVDVLSEQISTRDLIMSDLRFNLDQACTDRDLKEKNLRTLREHGDLQHVDHGIGQRRTY